MQNGTGMVPAERLERQNACYCANAMQFSKQQSSLLQQVNLEHGILKEY